MRRKKLKHTWQLSIYYLYHKIAYEVQVSIFSNLVLVHCLFRILNDSMVNELVDKEHKNSALIHILYRDKTKTSIKYRLTKHA